MNWIYTEYQKPIAYISGDFDGKQSDEIIAEDEKGKKHLAVYYEGVQDGNVFEAWYTSFGEYEIPNKIVRFLEIPD